MNIVRKVQRAFVEYLVRAQTVIPKERIYRGLENRYAPPKAQTDDGGSASPDQSITLPCVIVECAQLTRTEALKGEWGGQVLVILKASADETNDDDFDQMFEEVLGPLFEEELAPMVSSQVASFNVSFALLATTGYDIDGRTWEGYVSLDITVQNQPIE